MNTEALSTVVFTILWIYVGVFLCTALITLGGIISNFRLIKVQEKYLKPLFIALVLEVVGGATVFATGTLEKVINHLTVAPVECPTMPEPKCPTITDRSYSNTDAVISSTDRTPSTEKIISANNIEDLRKANGVSNLESLESGRKLQVLPNGKFGFEVDWKINTLSSVNGGIRVDNVDLDRTKGGTRVMEFHKSSEGTVLIVGYLPPSVLLQIQKHGRKDPIEVVLFFDQGTNQVPVAIPVQRILQSNSRRTEDNEGNQIRVSDMVIL